jgi:CHAT domain-containing protein/tetratricopeptide (TPR) repeat protein
VELAEREQDDRKVLALLNLGTVWAKGFNEPHQAMHCFREAAGLLERYTQQDADSASALVAQLEPLLSDVARYAFDLGLMEDVKRLVTFFNPGLAETLRHTESSMQPGGGEPDVEALRDARYPALDLALAGWRAAAQREKVSTAKRRQDVFQRMQQLAGVLNWQEAQARLARIPARVKKGEASRGGPGGLMRLAEMVVAGEMSFSTAREAGAALAVPNDDLDCLALFAMQDDTLAQNGVAMTLMRLCAEYATAPERVARFYKGLGMFYGNNKNYEGAAQYYLRGDARLAGGGHDAQRALLRLEAAAVLNILRRNEEALELARSAKEFAEAAGEAKLAAMAAGNMGVALLDMDRFEEALAIFEPLAERQQAIGDLEGLEKTRFNISVCYSGLGQSDKAVFDAQSADPDEVFHQAITLGEQQQHSRAIELFQRGFDLVGASGQPYDHESVMRSNFANTLASADRLDEAFDQMQHVVKLLEPQGDSYRLYEAYRGLAVVTQADPTTNEYYAERALQLGRRLGRREDLAIDLGYLSQARLSVGKYDEALEAIEEAVRLAPQSNLKALVAEVLARAGRAQEAVDIYQDLLRDAEQSGHARDRLRLLLGLADAYSRLGDVARALPLLREGRELAAGSDRARDKAQTADRLGLALLRLNRLEEAVRTFEEGIDQARTAGLRRVGLSLLSNLGNALNEMGDLVGAERTLLRVREESRAYGIQRSEAIALASLGKVAVKMQRYEEALARHLEAVDLAHEARERVTEAASLDSVGNIYAYLGKPERAVEYHHRASSLHVELKQWDDQLVDLINLSQAYVTLRDVGKAATAVREAQVLVERHGLQSSGLAFAAGQVAVLQGDWKTALASFREAIIELESTRQSLQTPLQQRRWAADKAKRYQRAAEAAILAGDGGAAIEFIESNKTRFLQAILQRRRQRPASVDEATWLRYEQADTTHAELRARRRSGLALGDPVLDRQVEEAEEELAQAAAALHTAGGAELEQLPALEIPSWVDLAQAIPPGQVAVSLAVYSQGLGIVYVGRDSSGKAWHAVHYTDSFTRHDLHRLLFGDREALRTGVAGKGVHRLAPDATGWVLGSWIHGKDQAWFDATSRRWGVELTTVAHLWPEIIAHVCRVLGERVWPCIIEHLPAGVRDLILMPSEGFNVLPLHAAQLHEGSRVMEQLCITYAPSLKLLGHIKEHGTTPREPSLGQAVNPTMDATLSYSELEAFEAAKQFEGAAVRELIGEQATVEQLLTLLKETDVFHFSGHAFYDLEEPFGSGLFCAPGDAGSQVLSLTSILERVGTIKSRLVVLSACETGQVQPGDALNDFLGLPGGFIVAGASAVLSTLWRVADLPTYLLLGEFFKQWDQGRRAVPTALTAAQKWLREVKASELAALFAAKRAQYRRDATIFYAGVTAAWRHFAAMAPEERPYDQPYFWAAFTFNGLQPVEDNFGPH